AEPELLSGYRHSAGRRWGRQDRLSAGALLGDARRSGGLLRERPGHQGGPARHDQHPLSQRRDPESRRAALIGGRRVPQGVTKTSSNAERPFARAASARSIAGSRVAVFSTRPPVPPYASP